MSILFDTRCGRIAEAAVGFLGYEKGLVAGRLEIR